MEDEEQEQKPQPQVRTTEAAIAVPEEEVLKLRSHESIKPLTIYQLKPPLHEKFKGYPVKDIIQTVFQENLVGNSYTLDRARKWTVKIANAVNKKVAELYFKRYKHVVQVTIGEFKGAGIKSGGRCIWDPESDGYTFDVYTCDTFFCWVAVFGIYLY